MPKEPVQLLKERSVRASLLPPTTSLQTGKVSFERNPRLNIVNRIVQGLEISTLFSLHLMIQTKCLILVFIV